MIRIYIHLYLFIRFLSYNIIKVLTGIQKLKSERDRERERERDEQK